MLNVVRIFEASVFSSELGRNIAISKLDLGPSIKDVRKNWSF